MKSTIMFMLGALLLIGACTPKATPLQPTEEPATTETEEEPMEEVPCPTFDYAPDPDQTIENYVLYRDFIKAEDWELAFDYWKKVYEVSPAADGQRNTVYNDGVRFYERFLSQTDDEAMKSKYLDTIFMLYDEMELCYPDDMYASARKAFDLYYKYPDRASKMEIYNLFKETIDNEGLDSPDFIINPFTSLIVDLYFDNQKISMAEAQKYQQMVRDIIANGLEECEGSACERWKIVEQYAPERLEAFETVRGFYDCEYYKNKYYQDFLDNPNDCDNVRTVYARLTWAKCPQTDEEFQELIRVGNENCAPEGTTVARDAYDCLKNADYDCAIENFQKAADETDDEDKKAKYLLTISKIYYAHLKNFPSARQYALQAAETKSGWGEPYIVIGRLYASSGPLCGPGRGWDSQIVVWPAIDMWNRAKSVDPSVASEANKLIARYRQYMPSVGDIFQRNLEEGDSFYVGCWIQENTTIRAAR